MGTIVLDDLDRRIIQALYIDPRAPFSRLADVLGSSEQTVARRYRRLFDGHVLRVVGQHDSQRLGQSDWAARIRCAPGTAPAVATKLAQRTDTAWVQLISGGTEIFTTIRSRDRQERTPLLLGQLTVGRQIIAVEAYCLLHLFVTGSAPSLGANVLSRDEIEQLRSPPATTRLSPDRSTAKMDESDWPLVQALAEDGRASYRTLAVRTHWHESTVRRRVEELTASGVLFFDLDVPLDVVGINSPALLWMNVMPAKLTEIGQALASRPEIPFVAATTGTTNMLASLNCQDDHSLYEYLTREVATLDGITHIETAPVARLVKLHATLTAPA